MLVVFSSMSIPTSGIRFMFAEANKSGKSLIIDELRDNLSIDFETFDLREVCNRVGNQQLENTVIVIPDGLVYADARLASSTNTKLFSWLVNQSRMTNLFDIFIFNPARTSDDLDKRVRRQIDTDVKAYGQLSSNGKFLARYNSYRSGRTYKKELTEDILDLVLTEAGKRKYGYSTSAVFLDEIDGEEFDVYKDHKCPLCNVEHRDTTFDDVEALVE